MDQRADPTAGTATNPVTAYWRASNGESLTALEGGEIGVEVRHRSLIRLVDLDPDARNPRVVQPEIGGEALNGFAHGIDRVLRPRDL